MVIDGKKMCPKCGKFKSTEFFHHNYSHPYSDGFFYCCKSCRSKYNRDYYYRKKQESQRKED